LDGFEERLARRHELVAAVRLDAGVERAPRIALHRHGVRRGRAQRGNHENTHQARDDLRARERLVVDGSEQPLGALGRVGGQRAARGERRLVELAQESFGLRGDARRHAATPQHASEAAGAREALGLQREPLAKRNRVRASHRRGVARLRRGSHSGGEPARRLMGAVRLRPSDRPPSKRDGREWREREQRPERGALMQRRARRAAIARTER